MNIQQAASAKAVLTQAYLHAEVALNATPVSLSHLVVSHSQETFLAIEASEGRFPIHGQRFVGDALTWTRADGGAEFMDLNGSESLGELRAEFEGDDGLMVLVYDSLKPFQDCAHLSPGSASPADVAFISANGQSVTDSESFAMGFAESERG